jgi:hypothetical protein
MDVEKQIRILTSENEFLQEQLEELNNTVQQNLVDLAKLSNIIPESEGSLRSKIEGNLHEIEQLKIQYQEAEKKIDAANIFTESIELDFVKEIKEGQKNKAIIKELISVNTQIDILQNELDETAIFYKKIQSLKKEIIELKSIVELKSLENEELKLEVLRLKKIL